MLVKNEKGEELEITGIYGKHGDDIEVTEINYVDKDDEVTDEDLNYVLDNYASDIYDFWYENNVGIAESIWEGER